MHMYTIVDTRYMRSGRPNTTHKYTCIYTCTMYLDVITLIGVVALITFSLDHSIS